MSLFQDSLTYGVDSTAIQAGDLSFGQKALASTSSALTSGLASIYNTGVAAANMMGSDVEKLDTYKLMQGLDSQWAEYYKANANALDVAGFIATSLLPGTAAVKGLNLVRSGESVGALGNSLNFFKTKQAAALDRAMVELGKEGGSAFTAMNRNKLAAMGWETADQVLQAAVFELGVVATMNQSPLLADDSWYDISKSIVTGALLGGAIGGGIGALGLNRSFKEAAAEVDRRAVGYTALSGVGKLDLSSGDKAYALLDSITKLPEAVLDRDKVLDVAFRLGSGPVTKTADLTTALTNAAKQSRKAAEDEFELAVREVAGKQVMQDVQQPFAGFLVDRLSTLRKSGASATEIRDSMGDILFNLRRVEAATEEAAVRAEDLFYFKKTLTPEDLGKLKSIDDLSDTLVRSTPLGKDQKYKNAYIYTGTDLAGEYERMAIIGSNSEKGVKSVKDAWEKGYSIALAPNGTLAINTVSGPWKAVTDPALAPVRYLNTRTGTLTDDAVLTAADRAVAGKSLVLTETAAEIPTAAGTRRFNMTDAIPAKADVTYWTARHAWAGKLADAAVPKQVLSTDISLLERLRDLAPDLRAKVDIVMPGNIVENGSAVDSILLRTKIDGLKARFEAGTQDIRALAYEFNAPESWVEKVIETEFGAALARIDDLATDMSKDLLASTKRENLLATYATPRQFTATDATRGLPWRERRDIMMEQARETGGQFVTGELAYAYRVQGAVLAAKNAASAVLGAEKYALLPDLAQDAAKLADSLGAGASFLGSSNANYGDVLRLAAQNIGKHVDAWVKEAGDEVVDAFNSVAIRIKDDKAAAAELGIVTNILRNEAGKYVWAPATNGTSARLLLREVADIADAAKRAAKETELLAAGQRVSLDIESQTVIDFLTTHSKLNGARIDKDTVLINAKGFTSNKDPRVVYAPPIDTNYFQHFAFVRPIEGKAFSTSEVAMVFGRNAEELQSRMARVDRNLYDVFTKSDGERYHKAKGDYDFDSTINERNIDSSLQRTGALSNFFPEVRAENLVEDYLRWHQNQAARLVRNSVELNYSQQIEELRDLGRSFTEDATSKFAGTLKSAKGEIANPYEDYVRTMLAVSKRGQYRLFSEANEFVDALGTRAYQMLASATGKAEKGLIPYTEANAIAEKYGIKGMYSNADDYFLSNVPRDRNLIKEGVAKANTLLANLVLRFDFAQSVMNVVSTPLLLGTELASIRTLVAQDSKLTGALNELTRVAVPGGSGASVPTTMKLLSNATKNFFGPEKEALLKRYIDNGDVKDTLTLYHSTISDLALSPNFKVFSDGVNKATEKVATLTGNNWSEEFTRFVSADVMRQVTEPLVAVGKLDVKTQNSYISTFVNRVQGNYISSQRPIVFQGVLGGAMGLFQTYSFNLLQQLLRHVENRDKRALATMFGMQAGLFGLNGTPMFDAINTHIIGTAAINDGHYDAYSIAPSLLGKEVGDWLMYGTVSAMPGLGGNWPALYTRGDINPRHMTILPLNPADMPAIDASTRVVNNLLDVGKKLIGGADISETLLQGLEHNGLNRPLAGVAQLAAQQSTTSRGGLISASSDFNGIAAASRIAGAKPMDEAIALNNMYRLNAYKIADRERMEALGERVKTHLSKNQVPPQETVEQFFNDYTSIGGRPENFNAALQRWMKDANVSVVEKMRANINSDYGQRLNEIMGGSGLEDWRSGGTVVAPASEAGQ